MIDFETHMAIVCSPIHYAAHKRSSIALSEGAGRAAAAVANLALVDWNGCQGTAARRRPHWHMVVANGCVAGS